MRVRVRARDVVKVVMLCGLIAELTLAPVAQARPSPAFAARDAASPRPPLGAATASATASPSGTTAATATATISATATATATTTATVSASATVTATGTVTFSLSPTATVSGTPMGSPSAPALPDATPPATTTLVVTATSAASAPSATAPALPPLTPTTTGEPVRSTVATLNAAAGLTATENAYGHLPLSFEPNQGQAGPGGGDVQFLSHGPGFTLVLTGADATLVLRQPHVHASGHPFEPSLGHDLLHTDTLTQTDAFSASVVRLRYEGAHANPQVVGENQLPGVVNYFIGSDPSRYHTDIPTYSRVAYKDVYPGVDLVYYGMAGQLEYDFVVSPGADPGAIAFAVDGSQGLRLDGQGNLLLHTGVGVLEQRAPVAYQEIDGQRHTVSAGYVLNGAGAKVSFSMGAYDPRKPLIIDPVLSYSTYLGGGGLDYGNAIAVDAAGSAYVTGYTDSGNFPTASALQGTFGGFYDAFVTKLTSRGGALAYSTYLGGSDGDFGSAIAVDAAGDAYVTGETSSTNFPAANALQGVHGGGYYDAFVTKLSASGTALIYSTYLGGNNQDQGHAIAVDAAGDAYVAGWTKSSNFPTANALQGSYGGGGDDAFVTELSANGGALVYSTYLGGSDTDAASGIAVDATGTVYVAGQSASPNFPTTNALQGSYGGGIDDAFLCKLTAGRASLVYSTHLGGSGNDMANAVAVDATGNAYLTGWTDSTDFPTISAAQGTYGGGSHDAFVAKILSAGSGTTPWHPQSSGLGTIGGGVDLAVDLADGHVDVGTTDMAIPGRGPDLTLRRTWDSTLAQAPALAQQGWVSSLTPSMSSILTGTVRYRDAGGAIWPFQYTGSLTATAPYTVYTTPPGQPWQLTTSMAGYTLTDFLTSETWTFDGQGRLTADQDAYGNQNSLSYGVGSATSPSGEANSGGRSLAFGYTNGLLSEAQSPLWQSGGGGCGGQPTRHLRLQRQWSAHDPDARRGRPRRRDHDLRLQRHAADQHHDGRAPRVDDGLRSFRARCRADQPDVGDAGPARLHAKLHDAVQLRVGADAGHCRRGRHRGTDHDVHS